MMLPLSRRVAVFLYCNISELNRATKEFFSVSLIFEIQEGIPFYTFSFE